MIYLVAVNTLLLAAILAALLWYMPREQSGAFKFREDALRSLQGQEGARLLRLLQSGRLGDVPSVAPRVHIGGAQDENRDEAREGEKVAHG